MSAEYYALEKTENIEGVEKLELPRARLLAAAISTNPDFQLVEVRRSIPGASPVNAEFLVVDVSCDEIPTRNSVGIAYPERLALRVREGRDDVPSAYALRKDFPVTIHQNQSEINTPSWLCLYAEPALTILRTWTAEKFLRRIQWWLSETAKQNLHLVDQPVENIFFNSNAELVLPWNFEELSRSPGQRFAVSEVARRPDQGFTLIAFPADQQAKTASGKTGRILEITLPKVLHGHMHSAKSLRDLVEILKGRGVDLLAVLRRSLNDLCTEEGLSTVADGNFSIFLLQIPIARNDEAPIERLERRAFAAVIGALTLGERIGALIRDAQQKKFFKAVLEGPFSQAPLHGWDDLDIMQMEVVQFNDPARARFQSGIQSDGPRGVVIGVGTLGSQLINLWGRAGWGQWSVVDTDHIKPHNLSRHVAYATTIGFSKVEAAALLHGLVYGDASSITPVFGDACDASDASVMQTIRDAEIVVDVSTTLEYPRIASDRDFPARHASVFITPSANSAVLLAEDKDRIHRLRTLEAQYYRAVINQDWGRTHLEGTAGRFWSGMGCRDLSAILPYDRVTSHAGNLADRIRALAEHGNPVIQIWERNPASGEVHLHSVDVKKEKRHTLNGVAVYFDEGLESKLFELRQKHLPHETGGVLLGYFDLNMNWMVVVDVLPQPSDSKSSESFFERGIEGLQEAIKEISRRTNGIVGYMGEWHSHPRGYSVNPSGDDLIQLYSLSREMARDGLPVLSLIVGDEKINVLQGMVKRD